MYAESLREHPFHYILIDVARITKNVCDGSENCIQHRFAWISHLISHGIFYGVSVTLSA